MVGKTQIFIDIAKTVSKLFMCDERLRSEIAFIRNILSGYLPEKNDLVEYRPQEEWFLRKPYGTHGIGHEARTLVLGEILTRLYQQYTGQLIDLKVTRRVASTHDIRRNDDLIDLEHGARSSSYYLEHLVGMDNGIDADKVSYVNMWHVPDDSNAPHMIPELMIFKDADSLDRVRLPNPQFRLNPTYLRFQQSKYLVATTEYLFRVGNALMLTGMHQFDAVIEAAVLLGIVNNETRNTTGTKNTGSTQLLYQ